MGGKFINAKQIGWEAQKEKKIETKFEIKVEKRKENKFNLPTTLVSTMRKKMH